MTLGERIKEQRTKAKISQEKLAELVGVSRQAVTKWESGQSAPSTENLFRLAEIFGTSVDILTKEEAEKPQLTDEEIYDIYKKVRGRKIAEQRRHLLRFIGVLALFYGFFVLCKLFLLDLDKTSVMTILFSAYAGEKYEWNYLLGWLWHNNIYWYASLISAIPTLFGKWKYSISTFAGFALGIIIGEVFGKNPEGAFTGNTHYGWAIWGGIFILSIIVGIVIEKHKKK